MSVTVAPECRPDRPTPPRPGRRRARAALTILALGLAASAGIVAAGMSPSRGHREAPTEARREARAPAETPRVKVIRPARAGGPPSLRLPADLLPAQESPLHARARGYLKRVLADIGDRVEAGQLLAEIEAPEMDGELDRVRATVRQAEAEAELAAARRDLAALNLKRVDSLVKRGAATSQEMDEGRAAYQVAVATVASAEATVAARKAEVRRLEEWKSYLRVVAPFAGTITHRGFYPGALVAAEGSGQAPLFRIAQDEALKAVVSVPQAHLASVALGQEVRVLAREFPGREFVGRVSRTARAVDPASRTLRVEVDLPNADRALVSGMFVEARFARAAASPLSVPASAVLSGPEGTRVVVVGPDGRARWRPIEIRRDLGGRVEVAEGLEGGEALVENPSSALADGALVAVVGAAPAPGAPGPGPTLEGPGNPGPPLNPGRPTPPASATSARRPPSPHARS